MKTLLRLTLAVLIVLTALEIQTPTAVAQGTAFTYQGRLTDGANPANGPYDFRFRLAADPLANDYVGGNIFSNAVPISNGLFTVTLDFGNVFTGSNYWLEIAVRAAGGGSYTTLAPLQPVRPTPYAMFAGSASNVFGVIPSGGLSGSYGSAVSFNNPGNSFNGAFAGNGAGLSNVNAQTLGGLGSGNFWQLGGNAVAGGQFIGSTNNQPVELWANGVRLLRLEPVPPGSGAGNIVGGYAGNRIDQPATGGSVIVGGGFGGGTNIISTNSSGSFIGAGSGNRIGPNVGDAVLGGGFGNVIGTNGLGGGAYGAVIGGGRFNTNNEFLSVIGGGERNSVQGMADHSVIAGGGFNVISGSVQSVYASIGGGYLNIVQTNTSYPVIGGGYNNIIQSNTAYAVIDGGYNNTVGPNTEYSTIGGGVQSKLGSPFATIGGGGINSIGTNSNSGVISGGYGNIISDNSFDGTIGGGSYATIGTNSYYATIAGGRVNTIGDNAESATVGGGFFNSAAGLYATVPGGYNNRASGRYSLAAGQQANATNEGAFVWSDALGTAFTSTSNNQFLVRAAGGVGIGTNRPSAALHVHGAGPTNVALRIANGGLAVTGAGVGTGTAAFVHVANTTNTSFYITYIDNPLCNNDPNALLFVTHNWNPPGVNGNYQTNPYSVYYEAPKWTIYNDNGASISNMSFNVLIVKR